MKAQPMPEPNDLKSVIDCVGELGVRIQRTLRLLGLSAQEERTKRL
jgi:hypothetical protein